MHTVQTVLILTTSTLCVMTSIIKIDNDKKHIEIINEMNKLSHSIIAIKNHNDKIKDKLER